MGASFGASLCFNSLPMPSTVTLTRADATAIEHLIEESVKLDEWTIKLMPVSKQTEQTLRMRIQNHKALLQSLKS